MENKNIFTTIIDNKEVSVDTNFLIDYIQNDKVEELYQRDDYDFYFGLTKNQFAVLLLKYIKHRTPYLSSSTNKNIILQGNNFFGGNIYRRLYKSVALNEFALQEPHESNDYFSHNYPMNPELKKELFNDLPHLDKNDLAIYLYLKLCYILRYDEHFDAAGQYGKIALVHEDPNRLTQITPEKCDIVCYEFVYLYAQILNELGIDYLINSKKPDEYGKRHISLSLKFDEKTVVLVDPTKTIFKDDLYFIKVNAPVHGFKCINSDDNLKKQLNEQVDKVYEIYKLFNPSKYCPENDQEYWVRTVNELITNRSYYEAKFYLFEDLMEKANLPHTEQMALANRILTNLFFLEGKNGHMTMSYFCENLPDKKKRPVLGIAYNPTKNGVAHPSYYMHNSYYIYNGKNFFEMEKEDLQLLFDKGSYNYINKRNDNPLSPTVANYEQRLPGIFENYDLELENENE